MAFAASSLDSAFDNVVLGIYVVCGIALIVTSLLAGRTTFTKVFGTLVGAVFVMWPAYVLVFGGWIPHSLSLTMMPVAAVISIALTRNRRNQPSPYTTPPGYAAPYTPPGTENWGAPPPQQPPNPGWPS